MANFFGSKSEQLSEHLEDELETLLRPIKNEETRYKVKVILLKASSWLMSQGYWEQIEDWVKENKDKTLGELLLSLRDEFGVENTEGGKRRTRRRRSSRRRSSGGKRTTRKYASSKRTKRRSSNRRRF